MGLKLLDVDLDLQDETLHRIFFVQMCRFNETERLLKELQASHTSLSKQNDTLRKNLDALQLQKDK